MNINFENDPQLGQVVSKTSVFCKLTKSCPPYPVESNMSMMYDYIIGKFADPKLHGLAGHKWSRLCGFTFTSSVNTANPVFQFVYVPKLRGNFTRNDKGLAGWYCWKYLSPDNKMVMALDSMMNTYGFNVNKFVNSDMFDTYVPKFVANVRYALAHQVTDLYNMLPEAAMKTELKFYVKAIASSLNDIYKVKEIVSYDEYARRHKDHNDDPDFYAAFSDPKAGHARVAYNADKTYGLKNLDHDDSAQAPAPEDK